MLSCILYVKKSKSKTHFLIIGDNIVSNMYVGNIFISVPFAIKQQSNFFTLMKNKGHIFTLLNIYILKNLFKYAFFHSNV